jgi:hypothetical protein
MPVRDEALAETKWSLRGRHRLFRQHARAQHPRLPGDALADRRPRLPLRARRRRPRSRLLSWGNPSRCSPSATPATASSASRSANRC